MYIFLTFIAKNSIIKKLYDFYKKGVISVIDIYNSWSLEYKEPFGAIRVNETCRFSIRVPKNTYYDCLPVLVIFRNGFKENFITMHETWQTDEYVEYKAEFTPSFVGVHYYYFALSNHGYRFYVKKNSASTGSYNGQGLFQLTVFDSAYKTPDFLKGGIMYQIFPDRFAKSGKVHENIPSDRILRDDWYGTPYYRPDQNGHVWNNDYFGGDLEGIIEKLDYLKSLGVTCIYLNPIFEAHENHRYNTANYRRVDPLLGTNEDFKRLCDEAKSRGISVILDGVFSHTGADSIYFNKFNRYDNLGAYNSTESEFYPWYTFFNYPDNYEAWWGIDTLPNVKENNREYTNYICGEGGVLDYWMSLGAAGYRLDVADELPDAFLDMLNIRVKSFSSEKIVIGEVWEDASNKESYGVKRRYLLGAQLDSVMNYPFKDAVLGFVMGMSAVEFRDRIMTILENYPKPSVDCLMNFISTHDIPRAFTILGGDSIDGHDKDWQAEHYMTEQQYEFGKKRLKTAMVLQYFLPGVPSIYYGDEAGAQGYADPFNRRCYPWGREDNELIEYVKELGKLHGQIASQYSGAFKISGCTEDCIALVRYNEFSNRCAVILVNRADSDVTFDVANLVRHVKESECIKGSAQGTKAFIPAHDFTILTLNLA